MGRVRKGVHCSVVGCENEAVRSLPSEKVAWTGLKIRDSRRVYLCVEHYKIYKKRTKKERMIESWRRTG